MPEHTQTTIDGRETPLRAPQPSGKHEAPPLFAAPQTIRGQLHMATDELPSLADHARLAVAEVAYLRSLAERP